MLPSKAKIMKKYIYLLTISLIMWSCNDFLDKNPLDQISSATFWQSQNDIEMALTANYGLLQETNYDPWSDPLGGMYSFQLANWDCLTDNAYGQHDYGSSIEITSGNITPSTKGYISAVYTVCYEGIARANNFLQ